MDKERRDEERYSRYLEDVLIARNEIVKMMLFPEGDLLCDLYAVPSHNRQSYYAIVYEDEGVLKMVYAKPQIRMIYFPDPINMYTFRDAKKAENHSAHEGSIIIGIKLLPEEIGVMLRDILENMPVKHVLSEDGIFIDGLFQAIRQYKGNSVAKEIVYRDAGKIRLPKEKEYLREQIGGLLYDSIESLIV